jgi:hypothetical protein
LIAAVVATTTTAAAAVFVQKVRKKTAFPHGWNNSPQQKLSV